LSAADAAIAVSADATEVEVVAAGAVVEADAWAVVVVVARAAGFVEAVDFGDELEQAAASPATATSPASWQSDRRITSSIGVR
jgi:hypothetical protein